VKYEVAVPSYRRPETIRKKTLKFLQEMEVPKDRIRVFVADAEEARAYREAGAQDDCAELVIGVKGQAAVRNFIQTWYPEDTPVLHVDDDLRGILAYRSNWKAKGEARFSYLTPAEFRALVSQGFEATRMSGLRLWGVHSTRNPMFMSDKPSTTLKHIPGGFYGIWISHDLEKYGGTIDERNDYERSLKYFVADGGVFRWNHVTMDTVVYAGEGGLQGLRTPETSHHYANLLVQRFPGLAKINPKRTTPERAEIRLVHPRRRRR
jgi:hypothetical protein